MSELSSNPTVPMLLQQTAGERVACADTPVEEELLSLFDARRLQLVRYATSFGLPVHDGEDLIQEVFLALFHHLQKGRPRSNLAGWVFRVTHNLALKRRTINRSRAKLVHEDAYSPEEHRADGFNPEEEVMLGERRAQLMAIYKALPETDRLCVQLRAEGLTYREIAEVVGVSLGTVSTVLGRSMARMARADERR